MARKEEALQIISFGILITLAGMALKKDRDNRLLNLIPFVGLAVVAYGFIQLF